MALEACLWQTRIVKTLLPPIRGYFAIGVEGVSKAVNLGNLLRSAHAFGASFVFTIGADARALQMQADTSKASTHLPVYHWPNQAETQAAQGVQPGRGGNPR
jgi:tRNA G18 (ribose-2'-O)-methylase SpoU